MRNDADGLPYATISLIETEIISRMTVEMMQTVIPIFLKLAPVVAVTPFCEGSSE